MTHKVRIARFSTGESVSFGVVEGDPGQPGSLTVRTVVGHPFLGEVAVTGEPLPLADVRLVAPILPGKILGIGKNYAEHAREMGGEAPEVPVVFLKPSTAVVGPGEAIAYPEISREVHYEAELAVVIGRVCREVPRERAAEVILGYTCANDVTARDLQRAEPQWARAKGFDTFCPLGPWIETVLDPSALAIRCEVNGQVVQSGTTADMIHSVADVIAHITQAMTLLPGDVVLTGTPAGVGPLQVGDDVAVTVEGIGTLTNRVAKRG